MATTQLHPAVAEILQYFEYEHLPTHLQTVSRRCHQLAHAMVSDGASGPELTTGLRKLLEAKDCFVRAALPKNEVTSFEHNGPCDAVEHPQGFAPTDE